MNSPEVLKGNENAGRKPWRNAWCVLGAAVLSACVAAPVAAQYTIGWYTVDGGGAMQTGNGAYVLSGIIGQPDAGILSGGTYSVKGGFWRGGSATVGVGAGDVPASDLPLAFRLHAAFPNPVARRTAIAFDLPAARSVRIRIFDASGRVARTLVDERLSAGRHHRTWEGVGDDGRRVSPGIYFVRFDSELERATQKVVVLQ